MKPAYLLLLSIVCLTLPACTATPPEIQTRVVEVPSSAPYRYITFSEKDDPETIRQVKRHNRAHSAVIDAEKRAKTKPPL